MYKFLQLTLWNATGLTQHTELKIYISIHTINFMLISETHFTEKSYLKLPNYTIYHTNHPVRTARGEAVITISWPQSASELYQPSDRRLSAKLVPTSADRGCHNKKFHQASLTKQLVQISFKQLVCQWKTQSIS
jgi:hypothetical protein